MKNEQIYRKKEGSSYKPPSLENNSRKGLEGKLAYNFQPAFNPVFIPIAKTPLKPTGLGYMHLNGLNKPKPIVPGAAIYKY